jgi:hypothetical protein
VRETDLAWKCIAKEARRKQVLADTITLPTNIVDIAEVESLDKAKQSAVNNVLKPIQQKKPTVVGKKKKKAPSGKVRAKRPTVSATAPTTNKENALVGLSGITNNPVQELRAPSIQLCGCRHGDLDALKSFTKAEVTYYIRPTKYLEDKGCLDCNIAVIEMKQATPAQKAVVYYCDQGVKGFDAPDEDPSKAELTCDLVLCPQCQAKRRVAFEKENAGRPGNGRKRYRQQTGV